MFNKRRVIISILLSLGFITILFSSVPVFGDRGGVGISDVYIPIYEPGQKAIICWDGEEEMLILGTDIYAEEPTKVLEILPLPSEPEIKTMNESIFENMADLVQMNVRTEEATKGYDSLAGEDDTPDVVIIFHEKLGVHNLTVIKALTAEGFSNYVADFLEDSNLERMKFPDAEELAQAYIDRDINYFVLDVIELTTEVKSPETLMFRFESESVYYPMEITSLTGGESNILLFILTPYTVVKGPYEEKDYYLFSERIKTYQKEQFIEVKKPDSPVNFEKITDANVPVGELKNYAMYSESEIYDYDMYEIYKFFEDETQVKIGVYEYDGSVVMKGDIDISAYSVQTVELDDEFNVSVWRLLLITVVPPIVLVIIIMLLVRRAGRKYSFE